MRQGGSLSSGEAVLKMMSSEVAPLFKRLRLRFYDRTLFWRVVV